MELCSQMHGAIDHVADEIDMDMRVMINVKFQNFHTPSFGAGWGGEEDLCRSSFSCLCKHWKTFMARLEELISKLLIAIVMSFLYSSPKATNLLGKQHERSNYILVWWEMTTLILSTISWPINCLIYWEHGWVVLSWSIVMRGWINTNASRLFCRGSWWQNITLFISKYGWVANLGEGVEPLGGEGGGGFWMIF